MKLQAALHDVVVPLAVLTPATAVVLSFPVLGGAATFAAFVALAAAIVIGCPLLAWGLARGWTRWFELSALGLAAELAGPPC